MAGQQLATRGLTHLAYGESGTDIDFLQKRNDCSHCHVHEKPGVRFEGAGDMPLRPTDGGGLYQVLSVLRDEAEVNDARGRDANFGDPHVQIRCSTGPALVPHSDQGRIQAVCPNKAEVPFATYDLAAALRAGQGYARAVCASRRYLFDHAAPAAWRAFEGAFGECALNALPRTP